MDIKKTVITLLVGAILGATLVYKLMPQETKIVTETQVVEKEKVVRKIVRETKPDGTVLEEINETENRDTNIVDKYTKVTPSKKYHLRVTGPILEPDLFDVAVGTEILPNLSVEASFTPSNQKWGIGLIYRF